MRIFNKALKIVIFTILVFSSLTILWRIWWYAPVSVKVSKIEKMNVQGIYEDQVKDCELFAMTPNVNIRHIGASDIRRNGAT